MESGAKPIDQGSKKINDQPSASDVKRPHLPSVDAVLRDEAAAKIVERFGRARIVEAVRQVIGTARENHCSLSIDEAIKGVVSLLEEMDVSRLKTVFNLTGTVLHTNLGRAQLAEEAIDAAVEAMRHAVALEFDLGGGKRGERDDVVRELLCQLTGAEDATIVNNNAAAVLIGLNTLAAGRGAIVSRGELIEIGGAFRMPDIMERAGTKLVEVGTTNRTHLRDYANAINPETGIILKVHTSNYRVEGFTKAVPASELAELAKQNDIPLLDDLGSGTLVDLSIYGLPREPTVADAITAGVDLVTFSGDKLLGGPQAGFIVGRKDLIAKINQNPMKRALRIDKIRLAAIEATLRLYLNPDTLAERLPTLRALSRPVEEIENLAIRLAPEIRKMLGDAFQIEVIQCASQVGSGAVPLETMPSAGITIRPDNPTSGREVDALSLAFRALPMPVIGRIADQAFILDMRCLENESAFLSNLKSFQSGGKNST